MALIPEGCLKLVVSASASVIMSSAAYVLNKQVANLQYVVSLPSYWWFFPSAVTRCEKVYLSGI